MFQKQSNACEYPYCIISCLTTAIFSFLKQQKHEIENEKSAFNFFATTKEGRQKISRVDNSEMRIGFLFWQI